MPLSLALIVITVEQDERRPTMLLSQEIQQAPLCVEGTVRHQLRRLAVIGRHINGTTESPDLTDGAELETDKDFEVTDDDFLLTIKTGSGRVYEFFGPELDDGVRGITIQPREWALLMPGIEKVAPRKFRVRLTEQQEAIIQGR